MTYNEIIQEAREYTHRTGDASFVVFEEADESYMFYPYKPMEQKGRIEIVAFYCTKYGTVEARDM